MPDRRRCPVDLREIHRRLWTLYPAGDLSKLRACGLVNRVLDEQPLPHGPVKSRSKISDDVPDSIGMIALPLHLQDEPLHIVGCDFRDELCVPEERQRMFAKAQA